MTELAALMARYDRIDATFEDVWLRLEAYAVIARDPSVSAPTVEGCTTCVDCCYPPEAR